MGRSALRRTPDSAPESPAAAPPGERSDGPSDARAKLDPAVSNKPAARKRPAAPKSAKSAAAPEPAKAKAAGPKAVSTAQRAPKTSAGESAAKPKRPAKSKAAPAKPAKTDAAASPKAGAPAGRASPAKGGARSAKPKVATKPDSDAEAADRSGPQAARPATQPRPAAAEAQARPAAAEPPSGPDAANPFLTPSVEAFANNMARLWEAGGKALSAYVRPREGRKPAEPTEIVDIAKTLGQVVERWMSDPQRVAEAQSAFAGRFIDLWTGTMKRLSGETVDPVVRGDPRDARFKDPEWTEHPVFDFIRQAYLHASGWAEKMVDEAHDLDPHTRHKAQFYVKLLSNAVSPSNFVPTNPELLRETLASKGENLVRGMAMLAEDIEAGKGDLRIRQTDPSGFEVGRNLAVTPGKVIFRNDLCEVIQYTPTTDMVRTRPLVIVPPWINKFYVLDLNPDKSMISWAVGQGLTVFCVSWVNPDARHAALSFDDYMRNGIMQAVDVAREICGTDDVDTIGYCVGGTLLSVTLAYMAATGDRRIASATLMTTQVDFAHAGDLKVFVDEEQIAAVEAKMAEAGYLEGASMANAFNMLRSNDMIFPYLVNNYLKGKSPFPFDLLYWNSDATRMPAANHSFYLRGCYLNNDLAHGRMEILGEKLDLAKVTMPIYELATKEDHIAPAKSVFLGAQLFGGPVRFVLAGSGHIAGVVNPPAKMKYQYWTGGDAKGELSHWLDHAEEKPGSWWPDWRAWLAGQDATMVAARTAGDGKYKALEDAPGSYVKIRS